MADRGVAFSRQTARRIIDNTHMGEDTPRDRTGIDSQSDTLPRDYREFELTAELSGGAGSTAAVKWLSWNNEDSEFVDSGDTGEVLDAGVMICWGISGDRGVATYRGGSWIVIENPGQPIYRGKLDADLNSGSSAAMSVWRGTTLADSTVNLTVYDSGLAMITAAYKIASATAITCHYVDGKWYLHTIAGCEEAQ